MNGSSPVAVVFAREIDGNLTSLVKKIDEATSKNKEAKMGSYVVFCTDSEDMEKKLKSLAEKEKIGKTILMIDNPAGPKSFKLDRDAAVTVMLYRKKTVAANYAFKKGELDDKAIDKIIGDLPKILKE